MQIHGAFGDDSLAQRFFAFTKAASCEAAQDQADCPTFLSSKIPARARLLINLLQHQGLLPAAEVILTWSDTFTDLPRKSKRPSPPFVMPVAPFKVKAVYDYNSAEPDDLNFPNGQIITVTAEEDDDWYTGDYVDGTGKRREGIFPKNFVEKYEPEIPLRPNRPARVKKETDPTPAVLPAPAEEFKSPGKGQETGLGMDEPEIPPHLSAKDTSHEPVEPHAPTLATRGSVQRSASSAATKPPVQSPKPTLNRPPPPQVAEKPDVGSFKDRMAMFNKAAAAPIAPFKPGGGGGSGASGFIKKPFVAPPPSKNAYVPPPREPPPQKAYRREEDPSLAVEQTNEPATIAPPIVEPDATGDEDQPKPTSLKDRIALLQKQQLEQAKRAEAAPKKEKPKKPARRHTEVEGAAESSDMPARPSIDRIGTGDTVGKKSVDFADDESGPLRGHTTRQSSVHPGLATPPQPSRELVSDTNDADDDTEEAPDTSAEEERRSIRHPPIATHPTSNSRQEVQSPPLEAEDPRGEDTDDGADEEEAEEDDVDPEVRRRMEIRERMAKMSGGMGMMGMFGPAGGMPSGGAARRPKSSNEESGRHVSSGYGQDDTAARAPPVPIMALPGLSRTKSTEAEPEEVESDTEDPSSRATPKGATAPSMSPEEIEAPRPPKRSSTGRSMPPIPQERTVPPPPPRDVRAAPVPPSRDQAAPAVHPSPSEPRSGAPPPQPMERPLSPGDDSDDERSLPTSRMSLNDGARPQSKEGLPPAGTAAPLLPSRPGQMNIDTTSPISPTANDKRLSRGPPPIPMSSPTVASPQARAPPPPPPGQPPSRRSTNDSRSIAATKHQIDDDSEEEVTEYDGDYDTDIASSAKHKDALKSHGRDSSLEEESTLTDESQSKPSTTDAPGRTAPPLPPTSMPREVPSLPPQNVSKALRQSADMPRAAPPPIPPPKQPLEEDYDPFRYPGLQSKPPSQATNLQSPPEEVDKDDLYDATPVATRAIPPPLHAERGAPSSPPSSGAPQPTLAGSQQSLDINRTKSQARRSMEQSRPSGEHGFIASDIDLAQSSYWWAQENVPPPSLQNRQDIFFEIESSTSTKRGGKAMVSKDVYVLYMDYSQSTITALFDAMEAHNVTFEQRHERPPPTPRQDQLESASSQFGARIAEAALSRQNSTVGDGSPIAFVLDLIKPLTATGVLAPIGTRAYGALVYANLANASTQQHDEIRAGDVVTFRNAKFAGHKGTMHAKYATEAGRPGQDHVSIVLDWDGTKKKIRVWEQGRDEAKGGKKGKVHEESYKVGDLKSGEVRVYRVMGRNWVGWDK